MAASDWVDSAVMGSGATVGEDDDEATRLKRPEMTKSRQLDLSKSLFDRKKGDGTAAANRGAWNPLGDEDSHRRDAMPRVVVL